MALRFEYLHRRVVIQLLILGIACVGLLGGVVYDSIISKINPFFVVGCLVIGLAVGFLASRIFTLTWHEETRKVIMSLDRTSVILIAVYIAFRIFGQKLLGEYVQGVALSALSFAFLSGILLGRLAGVWRGVRRILMEQGVW